MKQKLNLKDKIDVLKITFKILHNTIKRRDIRLVLEFFASVYGLLIISISFVLFCLFVSLCVHSNFCSFGTELYVLTLDDSC